MPQPPVRAFERALDRDLYFEAHEIMEAYWISYRGADRDFFKGLIQAAAALHHASQGNRRGAAAVARRARAYLRPFAPGHAGVDVDALLGRLARGAA